MTNATRPATLTIGTRRVTVAGGFRYVGVLRAGRKIVAECPHEHINRDVRGRGGTSATDCIRYIVQAAAKHDTYPEKRARLVQDDRNAWQGLTRGPFTAPAGTIARARVECAERADALDALIGRLVDLLADDQYSADRTRFAR
ncbi:hypothetical protein AB0B88_16285 [Micromonospora haikouensis]|uniref:hypothetical protein n=1 Tax=Micromonospora haikouensis TaxID=686309 RepID=UPI0033C00A69